MNILAIVGAYGQVKDDLKSKLNQTLVEIFDFDLEILKLMNPDGEGHRQILNFFGEEFLAKSGYLNVNKLWKFVYQDHHKLRILCFLLEPLLFNQLQKLEDLISKKAIVVFLPGLVGLNAYDNFDDIFYLNLPSEMTLAALQKGKLPVSAEQYWDRHSRLFLRPKGELELVNNVADLEEKIERWQEFLYI
jgi:dephospho-CoA kinase